MAKMPMQTPQDLFVHELSEALSAEQTIAKMLAEAQQMVQTPQLKEGLRMHQQQTEQHAQNIQQIFSQIGAQPHQVECKAAQGLYADLQAGMKANPSPMVLEGLVVGGAAKTEHMEIAAYTGLIEKARAMGMTDAAQLLQQNLQQEQQMLKQVEQLSQQMTQQMASMGSGQQMGSARQSGMSAG